MLLRSTKILLEIVAAMVTLVVVLLAVALWRLSTGPVAVDFLTPQLERVFSGGESGLMTRVGRTVLVWPDLNQRIELLAQDLQVSDADGRVVARLPDVSVKLSLRALLQGTVAPTAVELSGLSLYILRRADGSFDLANTTDMGEAAAPDVSEVTREVLADLLSQPAPGNPLSFLDRVVIRNARLTFEDRKLRVVWKAPVADISLRREADGLVGEALLEVDFRGERSSFQALLDYHPGTTRLDLSLAFQQVSLPAVAALVPGLEMLAGARVAVDGSFDVMTDLTGRLERVDFGLSGQSGELLLPGQLNEPVALEGFRVQGVAEADGERISLQSLVIDLAGDGSNRPRFEASAEVLRTAERTGITAGLTVTDLTLPDLHRLWPRHAAPGGRSWVLANVTAGQVPELKLATELSIAPPGPDAEEPEVSVDSLTGGFDFDGVEVYYLAPLPPATGVKGRAAINLSEVAFEVTGGQVRDVELSEGRIDITGLETPDHRMALEFAAQGPLSTALALLDHERLQLIRRLGLNHEGSGGNFAARTSFAFPLLDALTFDEIDVASRANLEAATLPGAVFGQDIGNGRLALTVDKDRLQAEGELTLGEVPLVARWQEEFEPAEGQPRTLINADIPRLDDEGRDAFGVALAPLLTGPLSASLVLTGRSGDDLDINVAANLQEALLDLGFIGWDKAAGVPGEARLQLLVRDGRLVELRDLQVAAGDFATTGSVFFDTDSGQAREVALARLQVGQSLLDDVQVRFDPAGTPSITVGSGVFDAEPLLGEDEADPETAEAPVALPSDVPEDPPSYDPLFLEVPGLSQVLLGDGRYLEDFSLRMVRSAGGWERLEMSAAVPRRFWRHSGELTEEDAAIEAKLIRLDYGPAADEGYELTFLADDAGAMMRAMNYFDVIEGGRMELTARMPGRLPDAPISARIDTRDYRLIEAPTLAEILTVASFTGIGDVLNDQGIRFEQLVGEFELEQGLVTTDLIRAYGPALGLTAKGQFDFVGNDTDVAGAVVPAYSANRILEGIPVLGPLLTGGEGEGIFAIIYRITGSMDEPEVEVNPLSALAPGFLRGVFGMQPVEPEEYPTALPQPGADR